MLDSVQFGELRLTGDNIDKETFLLLSQTLKDIPWLRRIEGFYDSYFDRYGRRKSKEISEEEEVNLVYAIREAPLLRLKGPYYWMLDGNLREVYDKLSTLTIERNWLLPRLRKCGEGFDHVDKLCAKQEESTEKAKGELDKEIFAFYMKGAISEFQGVFGSMGVLASRAIEQKEQESALLDAVERIREGAEERLLSLQYGIDKSVEKFIRETTVLAVKARDFKSLEDFENFLQRSKGDLEAAAKGWDQLAEKQPDDYLGGYYGELKRGYEELVKVFDRGLAQWAPLGKTTAMMKSLEKVQGDLQTAVASWQSPSTVSAHQELMELGKDLTGIFEQKLGRLSEMKEAVLKEGKEQFELVIRDFMGAVDTLFERLGSHEARDKQEEIIDKTFEDITDELEKFHLQVETILLEKMSIAEEAKDQEGIRTLQAGLDDLYNSTDVAQATLKELENKYREVIRKNATHIREKIENFKTNFDEVMGKKFEEMQE